MARANLLVHDEVIEKFLAAQDSRSVRLILLKIVEESIVFHDEVAKESDVSEDFNTILPRSLPPNEAVFGLFNVVDDVNAAQSWCVVVWIPEECRVRDKMLYSSSREDLRKKLGLGYFKADYPANQYEDLTWDQYLGTLDKNFDIDVLTDTERLVLEEKVGKEKICNAISLLISKLSPWNCRCLQAVRARLPRPRPWASSRSCSARRCRANSQPSPLER